MKGSGIIDKAILRNIKRPWNLAIESIKQECKKEGVDVDTDLILERIDTLTPNPFIVPTDK